MIATIQARPSCAGIRTSPACGGRVNSWDKRCSRALGYKAIVCEACISKEYGIDVEELRGTMKNHFGLIPCPGI